VAIVVSRGIHIALYDDIQGVKFVFMLTLWRININKVMLLKKRKRRYPKAPQLEDPTDLTEVPTGKIIEPEDMNADIEFDRPLEPEDM
jgi:hypothetical protein